MSGETNSLVFATQGGELSYHAVAARQFMGERPIEIMPCDTFGQVVRTTRNITNTGAIAICTVAGTVDDSAREIVVQRPPALPSVVGREDVGVELALVGAVDQTLEELQDRKVRCVAQKPALDQCATFLKTHLPRAKQLRRKESILAIEDILARKSPDWLAIGPNFAAEALGAHIIGPRQINPPDSITSFYILQQEADGGVLPHHPDRIENRTVISLAHPEGKGEFRKCMEMAEMMGVRITRFIPFDIGDFTKHNKDVRRGGGIFEVAHIRTSKIVAEFSARVAGIKDNDGYGGPFNVRNLGSFMWYPEPEIDPMSLVPNDEDIADPKINLDRFAFDLGLDVRKLKKVLKDPDANKKQVDAILELALEIGDIATEARSVAAD